MGLHQAVAENMGATKNEKDGRSAVFFFPLFPTKPRISAQVTESIRERDGRFYCQSARKLSSRFVKIAQLCVIRNL